jgi:hypothetical protein
MLKMAADPSLEYRLRVDLNFTVSALKDQIVNELDADFKVRATVQR